MGMASKLDLERMRDRATRAETRAGESDARLEAVRKRIEVMYEPHTKPIPWDGLRLGNGLPSRWYCDDCRKQWPCPTFTALRELHSITYGGSGETRAEVVLDFVPVDRLKV